MNENQLNLAELQDEYLDTLLRLAYKHEAALESQAAMPADDTPLSPEEEASLQRTLAAARARLDAEKRRQRREQWRAGFRHALPKVVHAAACVILLLVIATPIAVANVASIRSQVMRLLISIDQVRGVADIQLVDSVEHFDVPAGWAGEYYPSYIPEGMRLSKVDSYEGLCSVDYTNDVGQILRFRESTADTAAAIGIEYSVISYETLNGQNIWISESDEFGVIHLVWSCDEYCLYLRSDGLSKEETLRVAESVKKIIP